jgi:SAM-dependent methyltransferase
MELSQQAADAICEDQDIDVIVADFLRYENPEARRYDVVALRHVLEHLPDPILAMQRIGALLKDNGLALLEFLNTGSFSYKLKRILKNRGLKNAKYPAGWRPRAPQRVLPQVIRTPARPDRFRTRGLALLLDQAGRERVLPVGADCQQGTRDRTQAARGRYAESSVLSSAGECRSVPSNE